MGFMGFLNFGLTCIQLLVWPSLSLGYPLFASIRAIETNSKYHMRNLVTYWIIFSLISLFEHAFEKLIEWFPFWPYMKILAVCLLMIPSFSGAYNAYKSLVCPCLSLHLLEVVINLLNKNQELALKGGTFLAVAERYVNENGTEALEKLIAKKPQSKEPIVAQKDIKAVEILEENAAAPENSVKNFVDTLFSQTENETGITMEVKNMTLPATIGDNVLPESPALKYVQEEWTCAVCQVTTQNQETLNLHLQGTKHKSKCEELTARKQMAKNKNPSSATENKLDQSKQDTKGVSNGGLDEEWTCAICQVTTHSEAIFNLHLLGVEHWSKLCDELKASEQTPKKNNSSSSRPKSDQANQDPTRGLSGGGPNKQWSCALCQVTLQSEATMNSHFQGSKHRSKCEQLKASEMAAKNKNSSSANKTDKTSQEQQKNVSAGRLNINTSKITKVTVQADVNTFKHWCSVCDVTCSSESPMASHLKGRRHLLQIQDLACVHYWCNICDVTYKSEIDMASHLNGDGHFSKLCEELKASEQTAKKNNSSSSRPKSDQANQDPTRGLSGGGPNKQWSCALCQVTLQSEATINSHFQGSKHRSKCEQMKANEMAAKNKNSSSANKTDQSSQDQKKNVSADRLNKNTSKITNVTVQADVNTLKHWCSVCDVTCSSESPMASHLKGRRHLLQIQDLARVHYWCNICDVTCKSEIDMASHLNGDGHFSQLED